MKKDRSVPPDSGPMTKFINCFRKFRFFRKESDEPSKQWLRVVMNDSVDQLIASMSTKEISVFEVSGSRLKGAGFKSYKVGEYPEFDICSDTLDEQFDLIIAEQVFEHLLYPHRAAKNIYKMLKPGGCFIVSTPFLVRYHPQPNDCTRWTETGLRYFLEDCGFPLGGIQTGSWGNRSCVIGNLFFWVSYKKLLHSLKNDPYYPVVVWGVARRDQ